MKMIFEDGDGIENTPVHRGSEDASNVGAYWHAIGEVLSADPNGSDYYDKLAHFHAFGSMEINGRFAMMDMDYLEELASAGELSFDDIYEES